MTKVEGVFSGTMSYIFNEFSTGKEGGPSFSSVVRIAREKGYTVRCPRAHFFALPPCASDSPFHSTAVHRALLSRSPTQPTTSTARTSRASSLFSPASSRRCAPPSPPGTSP